MKIKNLIAVAALLLGSVSASAQVLASGGFKLSSVVGTGNPVEIIGLADDYTFASDGVVEIPATLPNTAGAAFKVVGIDDYAFAGLDEDLRLKVKGLKIAASVTYIGENAFADLGNLASVTFGTESEESNLKAIGNGAFAKDPMLKSISFANCPKLLYFTINGEEVMAAADYNKTLDGAVEAGDPAPADFETLTGYAAYDVSSLSDDEADDYNANLFGAVLANTYTTPFVNGAAPTNTTLTTITLNTGMQDFGLALANVENLATVNIKDTKIRVLNGFALNGNKKITALELPSKKFYDINTGDELGSYAVELKANALAGSVIQTLTINGNVSIGGVDALGVPESGATPAPCLTTVTFKGNVDLGGIMANAFAGNTKLATVTFEGEVENGAVLAGAFKGAGTAATASATGIKLTVKALKAEDGAFEQQAFADADDYVYLSATALTVDPDIYCCKWEPVPDAPEKIYVESNDNVTFYAKYYDALATTAISRGKGDVVVFSAYTDGETIYMDPLYSVEDKFVVAADEPVIVKVKGTSSLIKTDDNGKYIECQGTAADNTMHYVGGAALPFNAIGYEEKITNQDLNAKAAAGNMIYAVAKISTNGLKWKAISNEGTFYVKDAFYIEAKKAAAGVRVVWLDEENATAIQGFKAKVEAGQIYNLRGQKVNAAYKGVVIKDGKKYIQK